MEDDEEYIVQLGRSRYDDPGDLDQALRYLTHRLDGRGRSHDQCARALEALVATHAGPLLPTVWTVLLQQLRDAPSVQGQLTLLKLFSNVCGRIAIRQRGEAFRVFAKALIGVVGSQDVVGDRLFSNACAAAIAGLGPFAERDLAVSLFEKFTSGVNMWTRADARRTAATLAMALVRFTRHCGRFDAVVERQRDTAGEKWRHSLPLASIVEASVPHVLDVAWTARRTPSEHRGLIALTALTYEWALDALNSQLSGEPVAMNIVTLVCGCLSRLLRSQCDANTPLAVAPGPLVEACFAALEAPKVKRMLVCPVLSLLAALLVDAATADPAIPRLERWRADADDMTACEALLATAAALAAASSPVAEQMAKACCATHRTFCTEGRTIAFRGTVACLTAALDRGIAVAEVAACVAECHAAALQQADDHIRRSVAPPVKLLLLRALLLLDARTVPAMLQRRLVVALLEDGDAAVAAAARAAFMASEFPDGPVRSAPFALVAGTGFVPPVAPLRSTISDGDSSSFAVKLRRALVGREQLALRVSQVTVLSDLLAECVDACEAEGITRLPTASAQLAWYALGHCMLGLQHAGLTASAEGATSLLRLTRSAIALVALAICPHTADAAVKELTAVLSICWNIVLRCCAGLDRTIGAVAGGPFAAAPLVHSLNTTVEQSAATFLNDSDPRAATVFTSLFGEALTCVRDVLALGLAPLWDAAAAATVPLLAALDVAASLRPVEALDIMRVIFDGPLRGGTHPDSTRFVGRSITVLNRAVLHDLDLSGDALFAYLNAVGRRQACIQEVDRDCALYRRLLEIAWSDDGVSSTFSHVRPPRIAFGLLLSLARRAASDMRLDGKTELEAIVAKAASFAAAAREEHDADVFLDVVDAVVEEIRLMRPDVLIDYTPFSAFCEPPLPAVSSDVGPAESPPAKEASTGNGTVEDAGPWGWLDGHATLYEALTAAEPSTADELEAASELWYRGITGGASLGDVHAHAQAWLQEGHALSASIRSVCGIYDDPMAASEQRMALLLPKLAASSPSDPVFSATIAAVAAVPAADRVAYIKSALEAAGQPDGPADPPLASVARAAAITIAALGLSPAHAMELHAVVTPLLMELRAGMNAHGVADFELMLQLLDLTRAILRAVSRERPTARVAPHAAISEKPDHYRDAAPLARLGDAQLERALRCLDVSAHRGAAAEPGAWAGAAAASDVEDDLPLRRRVCAAVAQVVVHVAVDALKSRTPCTLQWACADVLRHIVALLPQTLRGMSVGVESAATMIIAALDDTTRRCSEVLFDARAAAANDGAQLFPTVALGLPEPPAAPPFCAMAPFTLLLSASLSLRPDPGAKCDMQSTVHVLGAAVSGAWDGRSELLLIALACASPRDATPGFFIAARAGAAELSEVWRRLRAAPLGLSVASRQMARVATCQVVWFPEPTAVAELMQAVAPWLCDVPITAAVPTAADLDSRSAAPMETTPHAPTLALCAGHALVRVALTFVPPTDVAWTRYVAGLAAGTRPTTAIGRLLVTGTWAVSVMRAACSAIGGEMIERIRFECLARCGHDSPSFFHDGTDAVVALGALALLRTVMDVDTRVMRSFNTPLRTDVGRCVWAAAAIDSGRCEHDTALLHAAAEARAGGEAEAAWVKVWMRLVSRVRDCSVTLDKTAARLELLRLLTFPLGSAPSA